MKNSLLPNCVVRYFWGDDLKQLKLPENQKYIIQTLLEKGDKQAIEWLLSVTNKNTIKNLLPTLKLSKKSANYWNIYFS